MKAKTLVGVLALLLLLMGAMGYATTARSTDSPDPASTSVLPAQNDGKNQAVVKEDDDGTSTTTTHHEDGENETNDSHENEKNEEEQEFKIEISQESDKVEIKLKNEYNSSSQELKFTLKIEDYLKFKLEFKYEFEGVNSSETSLEMDLKIEKFVEYVDVADENGTITEGYDEGTDTVIDSFKPGDMNFVFTPISQENLINATLYILEAISNTDRGQFIVRFYFTTKPVVLDSGVSLMPTETKFDFEVHDYSYQDSASSLAMVSRIESSLELEEETVDETTGEEIKLKSSQALEGYFTWDPTVIVDNQTLSVIVNEVNERNDDSEIETIISFPRGQHIIWDPKIGIQADTAALISIIQPLLAQQGLQALPFSSVWALLAFSLAIPALKLARSRRRDN